MRFGLFLIITLLFLGMASTLSLPSVRPPARLLILGLPGLGPSWLKKDGQVIPAGCGPEAARLLLWYWEARLGIDLVRADPERALAALHTLMGTVTVHWQGVDQGLTWPWKFGQGLEAYVRTKLPGTSVRTLSASLREVFAKAVELLLQGNPPVLLFDWAGWGGIFPNHYALVVGYDRKKGELVVNPGWGYAFQTVPLSDPAVGPVQLFWLEWPGSAPLPRLSAPLPEDCPAVRGYGEKAAFLPWCGASRAEELGPGLILLLWD
ncbi:MAG: hypothetical protein ACK42E_02330 [Candidatus Bipolaricaulaceae bacterium]